jgi:threonine dehydratase
MAQGVAWAARELGVPATVIAPDSAPQTKLDAIARLGGTVVKVPYERWWEIMVTSQVDEAEGFFVHPVQDERVMAGNGTIGLELAETSPMSIPCSFHGAAVASLPGSRARSPHCGRRRTCTPSSPTRARRSRPPSRRASRARPEFAPSFVDGAGAKVVLPAMWERARPLLAGAYAVTTRRDSAGRQSVCSPSAHA